MRRFVIAMSIFVVALGPFAARADDQKIANEIVQELQTRKERGELQGFKIDLKVDQGTVWLTGHVADETQRDAAAEAARRAAGVRQVVNDLTITASKSSRRGLLASLTRKAKAPEAAAAPQLIQPATLLTSLEELEEEAGEDAEAASEESAGGERPATEPAAAEAAPTSESNSIRSDEEIAGDIINRLRQLQQSGKLRGFGVRLKVEQGSVLVEGDVSDAEQRHQVLDVARRVRGVVQVVNGLAIRTSAAPRVAAKPAISSQATPLTLASQRAAGPQAAAELPEPLAASPLEPETTSRPQPVPVAAKPTVEAPAAQPQLRYVAVPYYPAAQLAAARQTPLAMAPARTVSYGQMTNPGMPAPIPAHYASATNMAAARYDHPQLPAYSWPSYAAYPNYAGVTYPKQYSPTAWPYIGPFYPYPQVPLGWRKVILEWDDGWWMLDFCDK